MTEIEKRQNGGSDLKELVKDILARVQQKGASAAEVGASTESGFNVNVRMGEVDTVEHNNGKGMAVTVYYGQRAGSASSSDFNSDAIQQAVEKACNIAKFTGEDPCAGLADKERMAFAYPQLDLHHSWSITPEQGIDIALQCEKIARAKDKRITNSEGVSVNTHEYFQVYANSHGFMGAYPTSRHSITCILIAQHENAMQRDFDYTEARDAKDLDDIAIVANSAVQRTVNRLGARRIKTQQVPVIFHASIASSLLRCFLSAISGGNLYRKCSFLLDHLGKQIFPEFIRIYESPHLAKGLGSAPFDSEGVATREQNFVNNGILQSYILGSYSARKLGLQSTGNANGVHNLFVSTSSMDFTALLQHMGTGLLVTELMGHGNNIVTGDYSQGAMGYWVEQGEIQYPVHEITVAGNLKQMFQQIIAIGNDVDHRGNIHTGSILLDTMMVAGE